MFILGAGASAPFGVPTLANVFKDLQARRHLRHDEFLLNKLDEHFWGPRGHNLETSNQTLTVEEILTLVRDFEQWPYEIPALLGDETERFRKSLYVLIKKVVYDGKHSRGRHLNSVIRFARQNFDHVTWASFNWDCIFEASFYYSSGNIGDYSRHNPKLVVNLLNWRYSGSSHTFLKLHGGINWWYEDGSIHYLPFGNQRDLNERWQAYEENRTTGNPVILEPSYYKYDDPMYELLKPQWNRLVESLLEADLVVIIDYSLPPADPEARRALTVGFQSNTDAKLVVVDISEQVCDRYERLFGASRMLPIRQSIADVSEDLQNIIAENLPSLDIQVDAAAS